MNTILLAMNWRVIHRIWLVFIMLTDTDFREPANTMNTIMLAMNWLISENHTIMLAMNWLKFQRSAANVPIHTIMLAMNCQFIAIEATLYQSLRFQRSAANMIANVVTHIHRQHDHDSFIFIANMSHDSFIFIANMIMLAMNWLSTIMPHV